MKFAVFIIALLCMSFVAATVETSSSGVFRGSLRHTITLDGENELLNVNPGDYLAFKLPGETYSAMQKYEEKELYIRRYSSGMAVYDLPLDKFNEINHGDSVRLDLNDDGADDVMLRFEEGNRWVASLPCSIACSSDEECDGVCVDAGTCDSFCENPEPETPVCCRALIASCLSCTQNMTEEEYCAENPETVGCPEQESVDVPENDSGNISDETPEPTPSEKKGWFSRILAWFAGLV